MPFSNGVKFKSKQKFNLSQWSFFDFLKMEKLLCFLMCPPRACPIENSSPQIGHGCIFGFMFGNLYMSTFGLLWLALWPPKAWKEENSLLHVLHLKPHSFNVLGSLVSPTLDSSIKQFNSLLSSLPLFMSKQKVQEYCWDFFMELA